MTGGRALSALGFFLFQESELIQQFAIKPAALVRSEDAGLASSDSRLKLFIITMNFNDWLIEVQNRSHGVDPLV